MKVWPKSANGMPFSLIASVVCQRADGAVPVCVKQPSVVNSESAKASFLTQGAAGCAGVGCAPGAGWTTLMVRRTSAMWLAESVISTPTSCAPAVAKTVSTWRVVPVSVS